MLQQLFVDRESELSFLNRFYNQDGPQLIILYGRRRVGKTQIITEFLKEKDHIYFLADEREEKWSIKELQTIMAKHIDDTLFENAVFDSWTELFKEFSQKIGDRRFVLAIDEFPYLIKANSALTSLFQKIWDLYLSKSNIFLILCGSSIRMMEKEVLAYQSPLYGRRTGQWKVEPLAYEFTPSFFPHYSEKDCIEAYAVCDGIPLYLKKFNKDSTVYDNIRDHVFTKGEFLYEEAEFLIKNELREPARYFTILKAISSGNTSFGKIVNATGLDKSIVSKYLDTLATLHIIEKMYPVTDLTEKRRNLRYRFEDNYFQFWFRFIYQHRSALEEGLQETIIQSFRESFRHHVANVFEKISTSFVKRKIANITKEHFTHVGPWWHKEEEIDVVAINDDTGDILFAECKWSDNVDPKRVLKKLKEKSKHVTWRKGKRKEYFCIFAKSFSSRDCGEDVFLFDVKDLFLQ